MTGDFFRSLSPLPHPDHGEDGGEGEGDEERGELIAEDLYFRDEEDDHGSEQNFHEIEGRNGKDLAPWNVAHERDFPALAASLQYKISGS